MEIPHTIDLTQTHGKIREIPEIRVWCHPMNGSDDFSYKFGSLGDALEFIKDNPEAEDAPLIAFRGYELNLFAIEKPRDTECQQ